MLRVSERERCIFLSPPLPLKEEFSLYQKLWDSLDYREKVDKSNTKTRHKLKFFNPLSVFLMGRCESAKIKFAAVAMIDIDSICLVNFPLQVKL